MLWDGYESKHIRAGLITFNGSDLRSSGQIREHTNPSHLKGYRKNRKAKQMQANMNEINCNLQVVIELANSMFTQLFFFFQVAPCQNLEYVNMH